MSAAVSTVMKFGVDSYPNPRAFHSQPSRAREDATSYVSALAAASLFALSELERLRASGSEMLMLQEALRRMLHSRQVPVELLRQAYHMNLYIKQLTSERVESRSLTAAFSEHGDAQIFAAKPLTQFLPDYSYAVDRLKVFVEEQVNWDGYGGLPASPQAAREVATFLKVVQRRLIQVPSVTMGGDGSVAIVWTDDVFYISADFDGNAGYSFFISRGDEFICDGVSPSERLDDSLAKYLGMYFTDD
ncbi:MULTISPECIES: hypothetical protein [Pseudomonas]|uniref:Uncharacterized protein n=4 Tax=Pseudomonas putida group TaxID=136845 RepID=A0A1B2FEK1_PSEPU|nr:MULTISPECIES: hypothetical protein [Pseudomonas]ANY90602.1 hypothetical protein IEC33019_5122 [Pseudomonas putida]MBA1316616.1 hypothetical protein [Pseudomonas monteilii]MBA6063730.1 hypothetical protein [Pseudomonas mosselii]MBH3415660.1 hypothetical protein [Pseudomonas putida]MBO2920434.1 hypothetical protein [Pseudomonas asiatica]